MSSDSTLLIILIIFCSCISLSASSGSALFFGDEINDFIGKLNKLTSSTTGTFATTGNTL